MYAITVDSRLTLIVLVWTDNGNDLGSGSRTSGPWLDVQRRHSSATRFIPVIQHRERLALKAIPDHSVTHNSDKDSHFDLAQSCALMHTDLGKSLDPETMRCDPFYSLTEIFRFAAASEFQFLDLMKTKIQAATILEASGGRISELQVIKDIIDEHCELLYENLEKIRSRGGTDWPKAPNETRMQKKAEAAVGKLINDFEKLILRAKSLSDKCTDAVSVMRNDAMYRESQKVIEQSETLAKLTFLASFFVPLSFTTSFFGMNFRELQDRPLRIWIWFVASIPTLAICFIIMFWRSFKQVNLSAYHRLFPSSNRYK